MKESAETSTSDGRALSSAQNGRKGGRPATWSRDVLVRAVDCLRQQATQEAAPLSEEMVRLARAIEQGTFRMSGPLVRPAVPPPAEPPPPPKTDMQVIVTLRVRGGKSTRGRNRAEEEVADDVLGPFKAKLQLPTWDYLLTVPYTTDEALDQLMSRSIPGKARAIAARRHCTVEYSARSVDDPQRSWVDATPLPPPQPRRTPMTLALITERSGDKLVNEVEKSLLGHFAFKKVEGKKAEYHVGVWSVTDEQMDEEVAKLVAEMQTVIAGRPCYISYEFETLEPPRRTWSGRL
jgi:hypothetical protein